MLKPNRSLAALVLAAALAACSQLPGDLTQADKDAVKAQVEKYRLAALAADWETWGKTLAPDVYWSPPNIASLQGRDAVVSWIKTFPKLTKFTVNIEEIGGRGDVAYARGTYALGMTLPDGAPSNDQGSFIELHRRASDGTWPYTHGMFHSTLPVPAPAPAAAKPGVTKP